MKGGAAFKCRKDIYARVVDVEGTSTMDALKSQIEDMGNDVHGLQFEPEKLDVGGESRDAFHLFAGGGNYYPWAGDIVAAQAGGAVRVALCGGNYTSLTPPLCREILAELLARPVTVP